MKETRVKFICDNCNAETEVKPKYGNKLSYPYEIRWAYLHNLSFKTSPKEESVKDKHFCSKECLIKFIEGEIFKKCQIIK